VKASGRTNLLYLPEYLGSGKEKGRREQKRGDGKSNLTRQD
jgi:hypothetical protein